MSSHIFRTEFVLYNPNYTRAAKRPASVNKRSEKYTSPTPQKVISAFSHNVKRMQRIMGPGAYTGALWDYVISNVLGTRICSVKKWFEAQISGILPDVFSYVSHFVCLYNFNYTGRPLRGGKELGRAHSSPYGRIFNARAPALLPTKEMHARSQGRASPCYDKPLVTHFVNNKINTRMMYLSCFQNLWLRDYG